MNFRRMNVSLELSLSGKICVGFEVFIFLFFIKNRKQETDSLKSGRCRVFCMSLMRLNRLNRPNMSMFLEKSSGSRKTSILHLE